jgi:ATP synthase protein I
MNFKLSKKKMRWVSLARYINLALSFGITMVAAVFLGFYAGWWVDHRFDTFPFFMLLGVLSGVGIGFYSLWHELAGLMSSEPGEKQGQGSDEQRNDERGKQDL